MRVPMVDETYIVMPYESWDRESVGCIIEILEVKENDVIRTKIINDMPKDCRFQKGLQWVLDYDSYQHALRLFSQSKSVSMFLEME